MRCNETSTRSVSHDDWLTCQKSAQYLQVFRKKFQKTVWSLKFTKSKVRDFAKNQWSVERNETQTRSVSHGDWLTCPKSGQYLQAFRKKVRKTVWSLKFTKSKARNFAKKSMERNETQTRSVKHGDDFHAKSQVNICMRLGKKSGKLILTDWQTDRAQT